MRASQLTYPICYSQCHNVYIFHFEKLLMLMNEIILVISGRDTSRPLERSVMSALERQVS